MALFTLSQKSEENALQYAAGFVCRKVTENIEHSKHPCMMLQDDNPSEHENDMTVWIDIIDRGGLWHAKDTAYLVLYAVEEEVRRHLHRLSPQNPTLDVA